MKLLPFIITTCLFVLLLTPLTGVAQRKSIFIKIDSAKQDFRKRDSVRRSSPVADTVKITLLRSPFFLLSESPKAPNKNYQLSVQGIRFRNSRFLSFLLRSVPVKSFTINNSSRLYLAFDDRTSISLSFTGKIVLKSNGIKNSNDARFECSLTNEGYQSLLAKNVMSVKLVTAGPETIFPVTNSSQPIKRACLFIR